MTWLSSSKQDFELNYRKSSEAFQLFPSQRCHQLKYYFYLQKYDESGLQSGSVYTL